MTLVNSRLYAQAHGYFGCYLNSSDHGCYPVGGLWLLLNTAHSRMVRRKTLYSPVILSYLECDWWETIFHQWTPQAENSCPFETSFPLLGFLLFLFCFGTYFNKNYRLIFLVDHPTKFVPEGWVPLPWLYAIVHDIMSVSTMFGNLWSRALS